MNNKYSMLYYTLYKNKLLRLQFIVILTSLLQLILSLKLAIDSESLIIWSQFYTSLIMLIMYTVSFYVNYKNTNQYNPEFEYGLDKIRSLTTILTASILLIYVILSLFQTIENLCDPEPFDNIGKALALNSLDVLISSFILSRWIILDNTQPSQTTIAYKACTQTTVIPHPNKNFF